MRLGKYRFAPPVWGVLVLLVVVGLFCSLGAWQIQRGEAKASMLAQQRAAGKAEARPLAPALAVASRRDEPMQALYGHRYRITGRVDGSQQILLDNQVFDERVGYRVWTPVVLDDGRRVLVDRGWVALGPGGRSSPPDPDAPEGRVKMTGRLRGLPQPGLQLSAAQACDQQGWPRVLNFPRIEQVRCQYMSPVVDGLLLLDENDSRGFARDWGAQFERMPPVRHYGYALQWFAMAIAVMIIFVVVNLKPIRSKKSNETR